jgi:uncharacterized protein YkwD
MKTAMKKLLFVPLFILVCLLSNCKKSNSSTEEGDPSNPQKDPVGTNLNNTFMLQAVNAVRATGCDCSGEKMPPVPALTWNDQLALAAKLHTEDMIKNNFFDHNSSDGKSPGDRIKAAGYTYRFYAENIAIINTDEQKVVAYWLTSQGHCRNIMDVRAKEIGVARVNNSWTMDLAAKL